MFLKFCSCFLVLSFVTINAAPASEMAQKWSKPILTYSFKNSPKTLSLDDTRASFQYAFNRWSTVVPKTFIEVPWNQTTQIDIKILFEPFNGASLGHSLSDGYIWISDTRIFKKYSSGEIIDPQKKDMTFIAMVHIQSILVWNNILSNKNPAIIFYNSNGTYILPVVKREISRFPIL